MDQFISYEKLSRKKQREINAKQRVTWGTLKPVTRKTDDGKVYDRKKTRHGKEDFPDAGSFS